MTTKCSSNNSLQIASIFILLVMARNGSAARFIGIGDMPGGPFGSRARGVSENGQIVVGHSFSDHSPEGVGEAFRWTRDLGATDLGASKPQAPRDGFVSTIGLAASADGSVVVGRIAKRFAAGGWFAEPLLWEKGEGVRQIDFQALPLNFQPIEFFATSSDGTAMVGNGEFRLLGGETENRAFFWTEEGAARVLQPLEDNHDETIGLSISADGRSVVGASSGHNSDGQVVREAFLWSLDGGMQGLGDVPGGRFDSTAWDVSADGSVVVGQAFTARGNEAFWWSEASGMIPLGDVPGGAFGGLAHAVSADGSVVVGRGLDEDGIEALIWDPLRGARSLSQSLVEDYSLGDQIEGWQLELAESISADGLTIVGKGINPQGQEEGFFIVLDDLPDPELHPGDIDLDGMVSLSDFTILKEHFGIGGFRYQGDLDGDFDVDLEDFIIVKSHFGEGAAQVPEPATWMLLMVAIVSWCGFRAQARRCFDCQRS